MLPAWEAHPPVPPASLLGTAALTQPLSGRSVPPRNGLFPWRDGPRGNSGSRHGVKRRLPALSCLGRAAG